MLTSIRGRAAALALFAWRGVQSGAAAAVQALIKFAEDLLIVAGLAVIVLATFRLSITAGLYALGVVLLALGIVLARYPPRGR